ncbi:MAG: hypothetical protein ACFFFT_08530 [Candidatus Thorarchaeota archaeon]
MVKAKAIVILLTIFLIIGIIHGSILNSVNVFVSWLLIGIWLIFSFKVLKNIKQYREYNSPHNTAFFTITPVFIGIFYSMWGNFTGLLGENLLEDTYLYLSWWSFLFGSPYILYGSISLYRCFKKYNVIYFGTKSVNARKFGYVLGFSIITFIIIYWISFYSSIDNTDTYIVDLNLLILLISSILIVIIPGLFGTQSRLPQLTRDYITQRTNRLNQLTSPRSNSSPRRYRESLHMTSSSPPTPSTRTVTSRSRSVSHSSRTTPTTHRRSTTSRSKITTRSVSRSPTGTKVKRKQSTRKITNFNIYKPKAARLSTEDFKCIFCFKLPKLPEDRGRGIILCPTCRYPAHADEFKDWLRSSNLCSRCNAPIPVNFRKNPKILSVKNYIIILKHFTNNRK